MNLKKGDKVRIKRFETVPSYWNSRGDMDHLMGKIVSVQEVSDKGCFIKDNKNDCSWFIKYLDLEPANETIVIYHKDNEVIALDKSTGKKGIARCCPEDIFDFYTGAKLAFERLMSNNVKEVHRKAKKGEYVKIVNAHWVPKNDDGTPSYKNGDILRIIDAPDYCISVRFKEGCDKNGNNYILKSNEYVVLEGYKPSEQSEETNKTIQVDDTVTIVDSGLVYTSYADWVEKNVRPRGLRYMFDYENEPNATHHYKVKYIAPHISRGDTLAYIQDEETERCYIISVRGVKKC